MTQGYNSPMPIDGINPAKHSRLTCYEAIGIIKKTDSTVIGNSRMSHLILPLYSEEFRAILDAITV